MLVPLRLSSADSPLVERQLHIATSHNLRYTSAIMQRPSGVTLTAALMAVLTLVGLVVAFIMPLPIVPTGTAVPSSLFTTFAHVGGIIGAIISAVFIFLYWQGYSWMRWVVMIYSIFPIIGLVRIKTAFATYPLSGVESLVSALLAVYLLWYLNTPPVKAWFDSPKTSSTV